MSMQIRAAGAIAHERPSPLIVFDANKSTRIPLQGREMASSKDQVLRTTVKHASDVVSFMKSTFGRDGIDGSGMPLKIVVHARDPYKGGAMSNAYWDGQNGRMEIGDGDGKTFAPLGMAKDILAHEYGHAILESEVKMGFDGQEGALHEHFGDVVASLVDADDWQIGEDAYTPSRAGDALRDMSKPAVYSHMRDLEDGMSADPHDLADIPNLAAFRVAERVGRSEMGKIWYEGFTEHLKNHAQFPDAAVATVKAAEQLFGAGSSQAAAVTDAWTSVGVLKAA